MKKLLSVLLLSISFTGISEAQAKEKTPLARVASTEHSEPGSGMTFGLGVSTLSAVTAAAGLSGSVTGFMNITPIDTIQALLSVPTTSGNFNFGLGAIYKHTLYGSSHAGFHIGGGVTMGTNGAFNTQILGNLGVHFTPGNSSIWFHLDGGPVLSIQGSNVPGGSSTTAFEIGQFSNELGASVAYLF